MNGLCREPEDSRREGVARTRVLPLLLSVVLAWLVASAGCAAPPPAVPQPTATAGHSASQVSERTAAEPSPSATAASQAAGVTPTATPTALPTRQPSPSPVRTPTLVPTPRPLSSPTVALPRFSGETAARHVAHLAGEIGSRPGGSQAGRQAAEYLAAQLAGLGYDARLQPYTFSRFEERTVQLLLLKPESVEISAKALVYSGSGSVEAPLASCGYGRPSDFPPAGLKGSVALIQRGEGLTFQEKADNAVARGASAVILFNDRVGEFQGTLQRQAPVPAVSILQVDGQRLQERLKQGPVTVSLKVDASTVARQGNNVVATTRGSMAGKKVVVGAHYDSVSAGPGANDNASGVATMLELASAVRGHGYPFGLVFVAFGDEEIGLIGSRRYVESLSIEERNQILAMINIDMVGVGDRMEFGGDRDLVNRALQIARQLGYPAGELAIKAGRASDHASFIDAGIPAVFFHRTEDPNYHTKLDTAEKVLPENLEAAGQVAVRLLEELGGRR